MKHVKKTTIKSAILTDKGNGKINKTIQEKNLDCHILTTFLTRLRNSSWE